jgi:hypothetical protein
VAKVGGSCYPRVERRADELDILSTSLAERSLAYKLKQQHM